jgi:Ca-activated chloride channel family protein
MRKASLGVSVGAMDYGRQPQALSVVLFSGEPNLTEETTILFDSQDGAILSQAGEGAILNLLELSFPDGTPNAKDLNAGLCLFLYVDDLSSPRTRVRLADIVRQGGKRPLNIDLPKDARVQLALADPARAWRAAAPRLRITLGVQ